jgi:KDO2-lipid IV(A) lauroyltransferase
VLSPPSPTVPSPVVSHDTREGGRWTRAQTLKNHVLYAVVRVLLFILRPLSLRALEALGRVLGRTLYIAGFSPRRIAMENLARAYPDLTLEGRRALAARAYVQLGAYLGQTVSQLLRPARFAPLAFEPGSREVLEEALGPKGPNGHPQRGVLFASAHLGPWEKVAGSLVRHGFALTTVARESYDPRFLKLYDGLRACVGVRSIYRGHPSAPLQIVRALKRGGLLGIPMDLRSRVSSIEVPFLGVPASTAVGPARIALRTGARVVVGTAVPSADRGTLGGSASSPPLSLRVTHIPTDDLEAGDAGELELTRRLNLELSARIRELPEAWVWMHPRWTATEDIAGSRKFSASLRRDR